LAPFFSVSTDSARAAIRFISAVKSRVGAVSAPLAFFAVVFAGSIADAR
jgi:hypothetical protein